MSVTNLAKRRGKILDDIMRYYREQLPKVMRETPMEDLRAFASVAPPTTDLLKLLREPGLTIIAGCQKASPVKGLLVPRYNAVRRAQEFVRAGATAVSIWTDARHYQGQITDLRDVREMLPHKVPVIRQDFIFHPYQVYESCVAGADALVLLTAVLGETDLRELVQLTQKLHMTPIVDVHTEAELAHALAAQSPIININRRNWQTFEQRETAVTELYPLLAETVPAAAMPAVITSGGYDTPAAIHQIRSQHVQGVLIGEALARHQSPDLLLREITRVRGG